MSALDINSVLPGISINSTAITIPLSALPGVDGSKAADFKKAIDEAFYEAYTALPSDQRPKMMTVTMASSDLQDVVYATAYRLKKPVMPPVEDEPVNGSSDDGSDSTPVDVPSSTATASTPSA
jgi:hypothetical protein